MICGTSPTLLCADNKIIFLEVIPTLFQNKSFKSALGTEPAISDEMYSNICLWNDVYSGQAPWLSGSVKSLNLAAAISSELARLVTLEMSSSITGGKRAAFLYKQYAPVLKNLRRAVEFACAGGGVVFKPYLNGKNIAVDIIRSDRFFPLAFDYSGNISSAVFISRKKIGKKYFSLLETHELFENAVEITNTAYSSDSPYSLGSKVALSCVKDWSSRAANVRISGVSSPLFAYFKMPFANNLDPDSPLGVSAFSRAIELIEQADKHFASIMWEYEGSELAVDASIDLFAKDDAGNVTLPKGKERLFRAFDIDSLRDGAFLKQFSPQIRDTSLFNGLDKIFKRIEFNCGLSYGSISEPSSSEFTATEIISSKQRMYSTVSDIQKSLENALRDLIHVLDVWTSAAKLAPEGEYDVSFSWDDSIIIDASTEQKIRLEEVNSGILAPEQYLSWRYGLPLEEAQKLLPKKDV